jgi:hypothetical protein
MLLKDLEKILLLYLIIYLSYIISYTINNVHPKTWFYQHVTIVTYGFFPRIKMKNENDHCQISVIWVEKYDYHRNIEYFIVTDYILS